MKRGHKPQPTYLKLLRGNPGDHADRLNLNEPKPEQIVDVPDPPPYISGYAADEWCIVTKQLMRLRMLTKVDVPALAAYCHAYGEWRTAVELLAKMAANDPVMQGLLVNGANGDARRNPLIRIAKEAAMEMLRFGGEFGLSPSARSRINAGPGGDGGLGKFDGLLG
jgi:P27 family predicted phage terminase small subunit